MRSHPHPQSPGLTAGAFPLQQSLSSEAMTPQKTIICQQPRDLDALVAVHLFGWGWWQSQKTFKYWFMEPDFFKPKEWALTKVSDPPADAKIAYGYGSDCCPGYASWGGIGAVVENRKEAGFWVEISSPSGLGLNPEKYEATFHSHKRTDDAGYAVADSASVAVCLAALRSVGLQVEFCQP